MKLTTKTVATSLMLIASGTLLASPATAQAAPEKETNTTTCSHVAWVSDSTGINIHKQEKGTVQTKNKSTPITKALSDTNVKTLTYDVLGGRSLKERVNNGTNGIDALTEQNADNTIDCYLLTMGTNDAANVVVGSNYTAEQRITDVLNNTKNKPVVWVVPDLGTNVTVNGYTLEGQRNFNKTLETLSKKNPRLHLVDMKSNIEKNKNTEKLPKTHDEFFISDGIHYTTAVSQFRSELIASAFKEQPNTGHDTK